MVQGLCVGKGRSERRDKCKMLSKEICKKARVWSMQESHAPSHTRTPNTAIPTPTRPDTTVAALVVAVVAPLVFGFVICPDVPFPFPVFDPPVPVPEPPPPVRLPGDPKDAVGILEIVDHVPPEREGRRGLVKARKEEKKKTRKEL